MSGESVSDAVSDLVAADERDGMRMLWDVPITMDDGNVLRADVFLPPLDERFPDDCFPVLLSYGPYAKGLAFQEGYPSAWAALSIDHPDVTAGSTNAYQNWEVVDPEKWTPHGYAIVRVDSRGCGRSPGYVDHFSARETRDYVECIAWAAAQPWSDGSIGLSGVSYFAMNQWQVAAERPPQLKAVCIWEGASDFYRDASHHGGILSTFWDNWYDKQIKVVQYGLGTNGPTSALTGQLVCGDQTLTEEELAANRIDFGAKILAHPHLDDFHRERSADWSVIEVPLLSAGNWGGQGLHLRGNVEGFLNAGSQHKWLELHGLEHWTTYYTDFGRSIQLAFFDHFLKGVDNGWAERPRVELQVRHADGGFSQRFSEAWPLPETSWQRRYLDPSASALALDPPANDTAAAFEAATSELLFRAPPLDEPLEITGPLSAKLWVSTTSADADLFLILHAYDLSGAEVVFAGAVDPNAPASMGWLRLSHRELDAERSTTYRPVHPHTRSVPVRPGEVYAVEVEIWPTSLVLPAGYSFGLSVQGSDYENPLLPPIVMSNFKNEMKGAGPFLHNDLRDRPPSVFSGVTTVHTGPDMPSSLLLPVIEQRVG